MRIKETIERECCESKDLKPYKGRLDDNMKRFNPHFCIHCGQIWLHTKEMGPAGSSEPSTERLVIKLPTTESC